MLVVSCFVCGILYFFLYCYLFLQLILKKEKNSNKKILETIIFSVGMGFINLYFQKYQLNYLRPYIFHLYILVSLIIIYRQKFMKTLIILLCILMLSFISELLFDVVLIFVLNVDVKTFAFTWYGSLFSNVVIFILSIMISRLKFIKALLTNIIDWYNRNEYKTMVIVVMLCMIVFTFFLYNNFIAVLPKQLLCLTNIFSVGVIIFVVGYFKEKANNNRIITEYDQLLDYVKKYEKLIESKSKNQHEYKNQLVIIRNMISKTNKKAIEYIDNLYNEESDDEDLELLKKLQYLPNGGLKGLIYYKLEEMKDKKINYFVDISPKVKNVKINKKIDKNLKDISKVIGVYLDNAIEASVKSKEKYIVLEVYVEDDKWVFSISNTYDGKISINQIDGEKFSTKGEGRGYGLSLARDIINHNKMLSQEREMKGIYYTQRLYMQK